MSEPRKVSKFQVCEHHAWLKGLGKRRKAEMFCEGGPAGDIVCSSGRCRLWAGTDLFCAEVCHGEYELTWGGAA